MDNIELEVTTDDHLERCRLCLKLFGEKFRVSKEIKQTFESFTNIELVLCDQLSALICVTCNTSLSKFHTLRLDLISKQKKLFELVFQEVEEEVEEEVLEEVEQLYEAKTDTIEMQHEEVDDICAISSDYLHPEYEAMETVEDEEIFEEETADDVLTYTEYLMNSADESEITNGKNAVKFLLAQNTNKNLTFSRQLKKDFSAKSLELDAGNGS